MLSLGLLVGKQSTIGSPMDLVWLIDHDRAVLVCSSEAVFEFVLGGDPDRLARVTGKPESQPGLEGAAGIASNCFLFSVGPQTSFSHCLISD